MSCWRCEKCGATNCDIDFCCTCGMDYAEEEKKVEEKEDESGD